MGYDRVRNAQWNKTYYEKNKERLKEYSSKYQKEHKKPVSARMRYKPQDIKCYTDTGIESTKFEKKTIIVSFD